ncbi:MAG: hypothetical protein SPI35_05935 [Porphyromonas sp.]|nr:hypothetical protein [Porphyromonas sp.]
MYTSLEKMQHLRTLSRGSHVPSDLALLRMVNPMAAQGLSPVETQKESILLALLEVCTLEEILSNRKEREEAPAAQPQEEAGEEGQSEETQRPSIEQEDESHSDAPGGDEEEEPSEEAPTVQPQEETKKNSPKKKNTQK